MAISRKSALKRIHGLTRRVREHLVYWRDEPESLAAAHWRDEIGSWIRDMREVLPHVGKKTAAEWEATINQQPVI